MKPVKLETPLTDRLRSWAQNEEMVNQFYTQHGKDCNTAADVLTDLLAALEGLFEHCAMIHKHWGNGSNAQEADAAQQYARAAISRAKGET